MGHVITIELLQYVEEHTGSRNYKQLAMLLEHGCMVAGRSEKAPKFLSPESLATMHLRWGAAVHRSRIHCGSSSDLRELQEQVPGGSMG